MKRIFCSYLLHGENDIFAGLEEASADDTYTDNLWNSYMKDEGFERFGIPSKRGRDWEDNDLSLNQLFMKPCSSRSRKNCDEPSLEAVASPDNHDHGENMH
ncbi:TATA box-binding protein associated factor RNA polymerase I subunit B-like protein [Arabidopsis thaliana]|jgi:hypothetical protein|uniref:TATA box-binding protein associated factor RNA polymerase I subunit B-like protein n=1 Tax=Arabidopsis thaliana TaxID=3702 RepID=F4JI12_ARATH|nr:TATA box-binding protein associated factor RNA polymerase I subunit B-like protein [Arabidopsis thaliana]NP_001328561.1 TATA box-binding protein associated factor RNA polymerase I subunit B-like protein [Arabidopsis thaliana]AEE82012.1 TATA box-binding protein associated factor RNA polymerase I subunit B-like protein [Arabidopsis thaliana]ANM66679.1 TATA box-binding protein associated factor RNA polymerase I subunit B-like protein [Arabidopsis thaliana]|eukprot:NP_001154197.1 TATA box-binding protein associated factor RNA polymerase I subunit B-like protein [Arabidopsis thaliana]